MTQEKLIAVDEHVPTAGAIVWWRLSGVVEHAKLLAAWKAAGFQEESLLETPSPATALRRAANELREKRVLVRPLGRNNGFAVVREKVTGDEQELDYEVVAKVTLDAVGRIKFDGVDDALRNEVLTAFERHLGQLSTEDFSAWLVRAMPKLDAVSLRDTGGVYFIPHAQVEHLAMVTAVLHANTEHVVHRVPALRSTEAVEAILDAIEQEALAETERIERELEEGKLGEKAYENRIAQADKVTTKVERYEGLLDMKLDALRERLERLRSNLTVAMVKAAKTEA